MASTLPPQNVPTIPAVAIVVDSSLALALEWRRILRDYCTHLFARLAEGNPSFPQLRLGFVTYGPPDCDGSPVFVNRFFALGAHNELKENPARLAIGRTGTGGSLGMAALEGYAAAIEVLIILISNRSLNVLTMIRCSTL
ncbi:hypothetical protein B0F90DRAFT_1740908 [Multifurca ochricompacta]|uniref:Uncharacterized protein n=1 Tax=Multifurca ochricompacta TaxID=376703 RepID=A0AAD4M039_9AGAM|nr:hypothetical protein B0F90DRAFT_1740908 [Multifurca ochricompacta]